MNRKKNEFVFKVIVKILINEGYAYNMSEVVQRVAVYLNMDVNYVWAFVRIALSKDIFTTAQEEGVVIMYLTKRACDEVRKMNQEEDRGYDESDVIKRLQEGM